MATQRLRMRQLREILRLHHDARLSHRAIARACRVGPTAVCEYLDRARRAGLGWPLPEELDDSALEARLFPRRPGAASPRALPDVAYLHRELRREGVTLHLLWLEYLQAQPDVGHATRHRALHLHQLHREQEVLDGHQSSIGHAPGGGADGRDAAGIGGIAQ